MSRAKRAARILFGDEGEWHLDLDDLLPEKAARKKSAPKAQAPMLAVRPADPAFQKWFAGSKAADSAGNPLRVFHGTSKDTPFEGFRVGKRGAWFTRSPEEASSYALENESMNLVRDTSPGASPWAMKKINTASRVVPAYLNTQRPRVYAPEELGEATRELGGENYALGQQRLFEKLLAEGYDSVIAGDTFVVLRDPGQIKSAISNTGAFDPRQKSVKKAAGGLAVKRKRK